MSGLGLRRALCDLSTALQNTPGRSVTTLAEHYGLLTPPEILVWEHRSTLADI
jgi:hypothetical protein